MEFYFEEKLNEKTLETLKKLVLEKYKEIYETTKIEDLKVKCILPECNPKPTKYYYVYIGKEPKNEDR